MYEFNYEVLVLSENKTVSFSGCADLNIGRNRIALKLPAGSLLSVKGSLRIPLLERERFFMNGFQSWTYSPEYSRDDRMTLIRVPDALKRAYQLDRYGDDYFAEPVSEKGVAHGESYCYFRKDWTYRLFASCDEAPGYTIFRYNASQSRLTIERDCKGVNCKGTFIAFDLFLGFGSENTVFDTWFEVMGIHPPQSQPIAGYSSWYNRYQKIDAASISGDLAGAIALLSPGDVFQIDDGWESAVGDWLDADSKKFPGGLKHHVDSIHENGLRAGLWLAPFVAQKGSSIFKKHKEWILRDEDGKPRSLGTNWGGFYGLDFDNPTCREYLSDVFRKVFDEWGFDLVKLDFLYAAAPFNTPKESRAGRMLRAMQFLRKLCGDKLILGCGVPLMPAFGLVDYCRIGCDVGLDWDDKPQMRLIHRERVSTRQSILNTVFRRQLNGRAFWNDPDVVFFREDNLKLTDGQKKSLQQVNALLGGVFLTSDDMSKYTPEMKKSYSEVRALRGFSPVSVYTDSGITLSWYTDSQHFVHIE